MWRAIRNIPRGQVFDENFLMALATVGAFCIGEYPEGVFVMLFYQVGELFEHVAVGKSRRSIAALMDIRPDYANVERDGVLEQVDPEEVEIGDIIVVKPGEKIPLDGQIVEGRSSLDTMALTGESVPRDVAVGDNVISGCISLSGLLKIRTTKSFGESTVSKILDLVENSAMNKAKSEAFITRFARWYTPAVVIAAVLVAVLPSLFTGNWSHWIHQALVFLVVSCPCALVISVPLTFFGGIGGASRKGILVKGANYLEQLAHTEIVVFDKTGTLTEGSFRVTAVEPQGISREALLETAALRNPTAIIPFPAPFWKPGAARPITAGWARWMNCRATRPGHSGRGTGAGGQRASAGAARHSLCQNRRGGHRGPCGKKTVLIWAIWSFPTGQGRRRRDHPGAEISGRPENGTADR